MIERGILYIAHPATNSMKQHLLILIKYLNRARYKPYLAVSHDPYMIEHLDRLNVEYVVVPELATANKLGVGGVAKKIAAFARDKERVINLIHSHDYQACFVGDQVAKLLNVPHICTVHTLENAYSKKKKGLLSVANDKIAAMPDMLIAVSEAIERSVAAFNKVQIIHSGIEADRFGETLDTEHLFRELDVSKENKLVGVVTRLSPEKGNSVFIDAAAVLANKFPDMHFIITGDGDDGEKLKKQVASHGLTQRFHFLGFRRDVAHILKSLEVVVIPNLASNIPMVLLEALACKRPVVVTDVAGVREVAGESCVDLVKPGDSGALASAVEAVLASKLRSMSKVQTGQKLVQDKFTVLHMMKPTESIYLEVAR
ncbi:MAG: glycosyltransferase family 4 protein [Actinobacteria bacterium]|nr:glycosyltransferase family 4 protein [Actinomycetota bacterium]